MEVGGIVLCGGNSRRMGTSKAALRFGPETMLERVVRLLHSAVSPVVVVAAPAQELPAFQSNTLRQATLLARDEHSNRGPLEGLRAGLLALPPTVEAAYVTSCDVPLLQPPFVSRLVALLEDHQIAMPEIAGFLHPLSAVYRRSVLAQIDALLAADRLRVAALADAAPTRRVTAAELVDVDPHLATLRNLNHPEDYQQALSLVFGND